jgi:hypothetical protein
MTAAPRAALRLRAVCWAACGAVLACSPEVLIAENDQALPGGGSAQAGGGGGAGTPSGGRAGGGAGAEASAGEGAQGGAFEEPGTPPRLLADSIADYSLEQGLHGWYYGYDDGETATFTALSRQSIITAYVPPSGDVWRCWSIDDQQWTQIFQLGAHANGIDTSPPSTAVLQRAVRRWVSNYAGRVVISGELAKIDVTADGSNGVEGKVVVDGVELYSKAIGGEDGGGVAYSLEADIQVGSNVDFVLDPLDSDDHHDLSRFTSVIAQAPPPT